MRLSEGADETKSHLLLTYKNHRGNSLMVRDLALSLLGPGFLVGELRFHKLNHVAFIPIQKKRLYFLKGS